jgi:hypothetical protein
MFVYNPDGFEPRDHVPSHLHAYADCARVLVHLVECGRVNNKLQDSAFIPRKAEYLRRFVHKEMYLPIRNALVASGVLEWHPQYVVGKQSYGFRIGERFKKTLFRRYKLTDRAAIRRFQRVRAEQSPFLADPIHRGLYEWLTRLEVAYEAAMTLLVSRHLPPEAHRTRQLSLEMLRDRDFFFKPDAHGRVHTNLTNLWSPFRQFLRFEGEVLVNIDIANSQPLFFGLVVRNRMRTQREGQECTNRSLLPSPSPSPFHYDAESIGSMKVESGCNSIPRDLRRYLQIAEEGQFYEHMMTALGIPINKPNRSAFKAEFFGKVFYCKPNYYTRERKAFMAEFPTVLQHITRLKKDDPRNAPLALQRAESDFVIGTVCKRILNESPETPLWTIHDSVTTITSRAEFVRQVMEEEFASLGVHPRLRIEATGHEPETGTQVRPRRSEVALGEVGADLLDGNPVVVPLTPPCRLASHLSLAG